SKEPPPTVGEAYAAPLAGEFPSRSRHMALRVTLVQGGGTGLDQVPAVQAILKAAGVDIAWDEFFAGWAAVEQGRPAIADELLASVRGNGVALKTRLLPPPTDPSALHFRERGNFNVDFRRRLGLFASVRPLKNLPGLTARFQGVDMLVIRE